jgi:hypothetical protein
MALQARNVIQILNIEQYTRSAPLPIYNYIDTKAKCRHPIRLTCKGTLHIVYIRTLEGGELNQREGERGNR